MLIHNFRIVFPITCNNRNTGRKSVNKRASEALTVIISRKNQRKVVFQYICTFIKGNKSTIAYIVWKRCLQLLKPLRLAAVDLAVDIERVGGVSECFVYGSNGANRELEFTQVKVLGFVMTFDDSGETGAKRYRYGNKYGYKYSYRYDYGYYAAAEKRRREEDRRKNSSKTSPARENPEQKP